MVRKYIDSDGLRQLEIIRDAFVVEIEASTAIDADIRDSIKLRFNHFIDDLATELFQTGIEYREPPIVETPQ